MDVYVVVGPRKYLSTLQEAGGKTLMLTLVNQKIRTEKKKNLRESISSSIFIKTDNIACNFIFFKP